MDANRIRELLAPFVGSLRLGDAQIGQLSVYLDLLLKWNARMNLTAIRDPEEIVQRHFGESLFAALQVAQSFPSATTIADVGSGAGFPGVPMKIAIPELELTLIESQHKKAVFLREAVRSLALERVTVLNARAETLQSTFDLVSLRAVESFETVLPIGRRLLATRGAMVLLIGSSQTATAFEALPAMSWDELKPIPLSENRLILIGRA